MKLNKLTQAVALSMGSLELYHALQRHGMKAAIQPIIVGTLAVDITSAKTGELLWRGISERDMHPTSSPKHRLERINKEVYKIFKKYPAGTVATSGYEVPTTTDR